MKFSHVLMYPDFEKPFFIEIDASKVGAGSIVDQNTDGRKGHPIYYARRTTTKA